MTPCQFAGPVHPMPPLALVRMPYFFPFICLQLWPQSLLPEPTPGYFFSVTLFPVRLSPKTMTTLPIARTSSDVTLENWYLRSTLVPSRCVFSISILKVPFNNVECCFHAYHSQKRTLHLHRIVGCSTYTIEIPKPQPGVCYCEGKQKSTPTRLCMYVFFQKSSFQLGWSGWG